MNDQNNQNPNETQIPVVDLKKSTEVVPVKTNLWNRIQLWHGEPKIGKTVQAARIPGGAFFLKFEPGHDHIEHMGETCEDWPKFLGVGRALLQAKERGDKLPFQTIVVDTAGEAFRRCQEHELRKLGLEHESDGDYGKGYSMIENEFRRRMVGLCNLGFGVVMIAHTSEKTKTNGKQGNQKREWTELVVDLPKAGLRVIPPMADLILFFMREHNEKTDEWTRVIKTVGTNAYQAGVRYPPGWKSYLPTTVEMDYGKLAELWEAGKPDADKPKAQASSKPPKEEPEHTKVRAPIPADTGWIDVKSSNVLAVRHVFDQGLEVRFKTGDVYRFKGVPRELFEELVGAESVGAVFAAKVKGKFAHEKLEIELPEDAPPVDDGPPVDDEPPHPADEQSGSNGQAPGGERRTGTALERRKS